MPKITSYTLRDLYTKNDKAFNARAKQSRVNSIKFLKTKKAFQFKVVTDQSKGVGRSLVTVKFKDDKLIDHINTRYKKPVGDMPCTVFCNCKAYYYYVSYYASKRGYNLGPNQPIPSPEKNPKGKVWICKHIAKVFLDYRRRALFEIAIQSGMKLPRQRKTK